MRQAAYEELWKAEDDLRALTSDLAQRNTKVGGGLYPLLPPTFGLKHSLLPSCNLDPGDPAGACHPRQGA